MDASPVMVKLAQDNTNCQVVQQTFQEITWQDTFDGIWACASLLHVPKNDMPDVFNRIVRALRSGGIWYLSFKYGDTERVKDGRRFNDYTEASFQELLKGFPQLSLLEWWHTADIRPGRPDEFWLNAIVQKLESESKV